MSRYDSYSQETLDEAVREEMARQAADINNNGRAAQIAFLNAGYEPQQSPQQSGSKELGPVTVREWQKASHDLAVAKDWWQEAYEPSEGTFDQAVVLSMLGTKLLLVCSELCEAFEEYRDNRLDVWWEIPGIGKVFESDVLETLVAEEMVALEKALRRDIIDRDLDWAGSFTDRTEVLGHIKAHYKPEGLGIEMADAVIRIGDLAGILTRVGIRIDLQELMTLKHTYNMTRPSRHGGKNA